MIGRTFVLASIAALGLLATACAMSSKNRPLASEAHPAAQARTRALFVLLPGLGDHPAAFVENDFIAALRESRRDIDVIAVDAHMGYYAGRTVIDRLLEDIILPAKTAGYEQIWLVGISMGGLGALLFAEQHAETIDGIILLAPYLGRRRLVRKIAAEGVRDWEPDPQKGGYDHEIWRWLKGYQDAREPRPQLYLGYGLQDRSAHNHSLLGELLPPERVYTAQGDHEWTVWTPLWRRILADEQLLPGSPSGE